MLLVFTASGCNYKTASSILLSEALFQTMRVRSSVRLEHRTLNPRVAGSIPVGPANIYVHLYRSLSIKGIPLPQPSIGHIRYLACFDKVPWKTVFEKIKKSVDPTMINPEILNHSFVRPTIDFCSKNAHMFLTLDRYRWKN